MPQAGVLADLCFSGNHEAQVSEYRDLWHPSFQADPPIPRSGPTAGKILSYSKATPP
jgi:hypothetical protein